MQKMNITERETKDFFVQAFTSRNLIPILGAGFSANMHARNNYTIPTGSELKDDMIKLILSERSEFNEGALKSKPFSWIAERFFECDFEKISEYMYNHFTGIKFDDIIKQQFLNEINWPYVYTLNIDTAIESSNWGNWEVYYPNEDFFDKSVYDRKKLYKIHGDVNQFCKTKDVNKFIFSQSQYLKSLRDNSYFHDILSADCIGKNLIFIGCSLDDELDIKYTVIGDKDRHKDTTNARRVYVTTDDIENDPIKKEDLRDFNITHYIKLESSEDYELFYEFLLECYKESLRAQTRSFECYRVTQTSILSEERKENLQYLMNIEGNKTLCKPYYYYEKEGFCIDDLMTNKINVFIGRRFSGKTLFTYGIIDKLKDRKKYYIASDQTISDSDIVDLFEEERIAILIDANAISDSQLSLICECFDKTKDSIVCLVVNAFDEIVNGISYYPEILHVSELKFDGRITKMERKTINKKLSDLGIVIFKEKQTILDNTLRIGNELNEDRLSKYKITDEKELTMLIWIAVNKKIYLEQIMTLSLYNDFDRIVKKFAPILEISQNDEKGKYEHSQFKIVCNAPIALLQILNNYAYPPRTAMGNAVKRARFDSICNAIYTILRTYEKINQDEVKKFLQFDTLNDVFSRQYSKENVDKLSQKRKEEERRTYGAAALIQAIYENTNIQKLKSEEPNYWLQRAKSLYILNSGKRGKISKLHEGIAWAKKAIGDSQVLINEGHNRYNRTLSNAIIQAAMLYGKLAARKGYKDKAVNTEAVRYYSMGLSDNNNMYAAKSLIERSRGSKDFKLLLDNIRNNKHIIYKEAFEDANYLCNIPEYSNGIVYRLIG